MAPRRHLTAHEMKRDEFVSWVTKATYWMEENARTVLIGIGATALVFILIAVGLTWHRSRQTKMYEMLADIQRVARTRLAGEPGAGPDAFANPRERASRVVEAADRMLASYSTGAAVSWARYARAEALLELGRAEEASEDAGAVVGRADRDTLLGGLAGVVQARAEEARGNLQRAADLYAEVAAGAAGAFPPEAALLQRARCLNALGSREEAISTYREILDRYPESPLAAEATQKLEQLSERAEGT